MSVIILTETNFDAEAMKENKMPVLVDFWAPWCGPCKMQDPVIEEIAKEFEGKVKVAKLNVDENPNMPSRFGIMSVPTLVIIKNGNVVKQMVGYQNKTILTNALNTA